MWLTVLYRNRRWQVNHSFDQFGLLQIWRGIKSSFKLLARQAVAILQWWNALRQGENPGSNRRHTHHYTLSPRPRPRLHHQVLRRAGINLPKPVLQEFIQFHLLLPHETLLWQPPAG